MCGTDFCRAHFHEWYKESTWCWLAVKLVLLLIVAAIWCTISGMENQGEYMGPKLLDPERALIVVMFMIFVGFLIIVYTPWQHKLAPWWFKILGLLLYFGTLIFFYWEFHLAEDGGVLPDDKASWNTNSVPIDAWTLNHFFVGIIFGYMLPFVWMVLVVIGWEVLELFVYGAGDEVSMNAIVDVVVAIIAWWIVILIFSRRCIPWISARCAHEAREKAEEDRHGIAHHAQDECDDYDVYGAGV